MDSVLNIVLGLLVICCVTLQKTYSALPVKELKRRARAGNRAARTIHKAASYGQSLRTVLWLLIIIFSTAFFFEVERTAPAWFALTASVVLIWLAYVWLPSSPVSLVGERLAVMAAPSLAWMLSYLHGPLNRMIGLVRGSRPVNAHTKLYEKEDLLDLLKQQQKQADNRIDKFELDIAMTALRFGDQLIRKHLTPRRMVKTVSIEEAVGPVLMDELHKSGHSRFPIHDGKKDNIVGTLYMRDLVEAKEKTRVRDLMKPKVTYVHEEQNLYDALQAVIKTHRHLLVVVNSFEEYVGIITLEDILEQIVGKPIVDEFDQYQDLRAVAARAAKAEHEEHDKAENTTPEPPEVIESKDESNTSK